ncbi:hypothetical protein AB0J48_09965 [Nocardia salmonicida]|uniref:hypothetical protein n=1 Tax=Nocardia salmonicida TaxID=53431 RepID=UPI0034212103
MRTTLNIAAVTVAAAAIVGTTAAVAEGQTGSAAIDYGSSAVQSAGSFVERGDIIGLIVLLGITPIHMLTGGICDLATFSALPDPCSPTRY